MPILNALAKDIDSFFMRQPRSRILAMGILTVTVMGFLDFLTGVDFSFAIFYLIPITFVAWYLTMSEAISIAVFSYIAMATSDMAAGMKYPLHPLLHLWNELIRLAFFLIYACLISELHRLFESERALSRTDPLTRISNRRAFQEALEGEVSRARRYLNPVTLAYIDIDRFKGVNDQFGHSVGDQVLEQVAATIKAGLRSTDTVARMGGDEFAVILPLARAAISMAVIQKIRASLDDLVERNRWPIGFSVGCVTFSSPPNSAEDVVHRADQVMYACKKSGGSSIIHEELEGVASAKISEKILESVGI